MIINGRWFVLKGFLSDKHKWAMCYRVIGNNVFKYLILKAKVGDENWKTIGNFVLEQEAIDAYIALKQAEIDRVGWVNKMRLNPDDPTEEESLRTQYGSNEEFGAF